MDYPISNQIFSHLEFLGYVPEDKSSSETKIDALLATSETKSNLIIMILENEEIYIRARYNNKGKIDKKILEAVNSANDKSMATSWYAEEDDKGHIINICLYLWGYDKKKFTNAIQKLEEEVIGSMEFFV